MTNTIHMVKLSVGTESVEGLAEWQKSRAALRADGCSFHITRMWPKREAELLAGGSVYWVIKGAIQCRQAIRAFEEVIGEDGIRRCAVVLEPELFYTAPTLKRPFQGWRYLKAADAPPDLPKARQSDDALPPELAGKLAEIGIL